MAIDREHLESRRAIMPLRISVKVHVAQPRDAAPTMNGPFPAERRPMSVSERRSVDAAGKQATNQYCFFQVELGSLKLKEGDIVEDVELASFHTIESLSIELAGVRVKANCAMTVNPSMAVQ